MDIYNVDQLIAEGVLDPTIFEELDTVGWRADQRTEEWLMENCEFYFDCWSKVHMEYPYHNLRYAPPTVAIAHEHSTRMAVI